MPSNGQCLMVKSSDKIRKVTELPVKYRSVFAPHTTFNAVQSVLLDCLLASNSSVVVSAPTGSGKTTLFELAIIRLIETTCGSDSANLAGNKIIYIAPVKALCSERFADWANKFRPLGIRTAEMTGDSTYPVELKTIENFDLILTTPEKWDAMTRKWKDHTGIVQLIKLFLIDEVHLLNEERRGPTLEAIVSRMKAVDEALKRNGGGSFIRFVAVSATIPNINDVADWLGTPQNAAKSFKFDESVRPVSLNKIVLGYPLTSKPYMFDVNLTYKLKQIIMTHAHGKPTLIFCSTRKGVQQTCSILKKNLSFNFTPEQTEKLDEASERIVDPTLRGVIKLGIAYHHAGLMLTDRQCIEDIFRAGFLPVLISTRTLAMGVNLPAHLVIIKSTEQYVSGEWIPYSESQILQMMGRAGRPQFDSSATAVIMTRESTKEKYEKLVSGEELIESSLHNYLVEHLNSEVVLGTITDIPLAMSWLRSTFLYVRAMKNPKHYGIHSNLSGREIESKLQGMFMRELHALEKYELITTSDFAYKVEPTENGKLMARYYIAFETMKIFMKIEGTENIPKVLSHLTQCQELHEIQLRRHEKPILNNLNRHKIRFPIPGKITTKAGKASVLIQAVLGSVQIPDSGLLQESINIMRLVERLLKGLTLYLGRKNNFQALASALTLQKCVFVKMWENSPLACRQLPGIGPALGALLVAAGKGSFSEIINTNPRTLERIINRQPPMGNTLQEAASRMPQYNLEVVVNERCSLVFVHIKLLNADEVLYGNLLHKFTILVSAENKVLKHEVISDQALVSQNGHHSLQVFAGKVIEEASEITATLISSTIVGVDMQVKIRPISNNIDPNQNIETNSSTINTRSKTASRKPENARLKDAASNLLEKYSFVPTRSKKLLHHSKTGPSSDEITAENGHSKTSFPKGKSLAATEQEKIDLLDSDGPELHDGNECFPIAQSKAVNEVNREIIEIVSSDDSINAGYTQPALSFCTSTSKNVVSAGSRADSLQVPAVVSSAKCDTHPSEASSNSIKTNLGFDIDDLFDSLSSENAQPQDQEISEPAPEISLRSDIKGASESPEKKTVEDNRGKQKCVVSESHLQNSPCFEVDDLFNSESSEIVLMDDELDHFRADSNELEKTSLNSRAKLATDYQKSHFEAVENQKKLVKIPAVEDSPDDSPIQSIGPKNTVAGAGLHMCDNQIRDAALPIPSRSRILSGSTNEIRNTSQHHLNDHRYKPETTLARGMYSVNEIMSFNDSVTPEAYSVPVGEPDDLQESPELMCYDGNCTDEMDSSKWTFLNLPPCETSRTRLDTDCYNSATNSIHQLQLSQGRDPLRSSQGDVFKFTGYPRKLRQTYEVPSTSNEVLPQESVFASPNLESYGFQVNPVLPEMAFEGTTPFYSSQTPATTYTNNFSEVFSRAIDRMENNAVQNFSQLSPLEFPKDRRREIQYSEGHRRLPRAPVQKRRRLSSSPVRQEDVMSSPPSQGVGSSVCTSLSGLLAVHNGYSRTLNRFDVG